MLVRQDTAGAQFTPGSSVAVALGDRAQPPVIIALGQLGHPLPREVVGGIWQWKTLARQPAHGGRRQTSLRLAMRVLANLANRAG